MVKYVGESQYEHGSEECLGVLAVNLGTPNAPTPRALRRYLAEFLSDPRVVEAPRPLWWLVLHGVILRVRPRRSARLYAKVWTAEGAPLRRICERQAERLQSELEKRIRGPVKVVLAMRYGEPSVRTALGRLRAAGARRLLVLPLYPQYSGSTTGSTFDAVTRELRNWRWIPELRFITQYHDHPAYISALASSIREHWSEYGQAQRLLFSFHGTPRDYLLQGDPYHCQCRKSARLIAETLGLSPDRWEVTFQSRFGPREWLKPYTDERLRELARTGIKHVEVMCPGFSADCLETLEEIDGQNREIFLNAGGEQFCYIAALNERQDHIEALADLVERHAIAWPETSPGWDAKRAMNERAASRARAIALGAER
jgi:ferrochelatase